MPESLHARLPLEELAAERRELAGRVDAAGLAGRVAGALGREATAGEVSYRLAFAPGAAGAIELTGELRARLEAQCQRCLQPFEIEFEAPVRLVFPPPGRPAGPEYAEWEAGEDGARPTLAEILEEELLLALPFTPRHPPGRCPGGPVGEAPAAQEAGEDEEPRQRPFAGLDELVRRGGD